MVRPAFSKTPAGFICLMKYVRWLSHIKSCYIPSSPTDLFDFYVLPKRSMLNCRWNAIDCSVAFMSSGRGSPGEWVVANCGHPAATGEGFLPSTVYCHIKSYYNMVYYQKWFFGCFWRWGIPAKQQMGIILVTVFVPCFQMNQIPSRVSLVFAWQYCSTPICSLEFKLWRRGWLASSKVCSSLRPDSLGRNGVRNCFVAIWTWFSLFILPRCDVPAWTITRFAHIRSHRYWLLELILSMEVACPSSWLWSQEVTGS